MISDSSDEELPLLLEMPAEQQREEDDDDVVILAEVIFHSYICPALFMAFIANSCANIWCIPLRVMSGYSNLLRISEMHVEMMAFCWL